MTKYILHGGVTRRDTENNKKFFQEIIKDAIDPVRILCVYFARQKQRAELFARDQRLFHERVVNHEIDFENAELDVPTLVQQIQRANVIYLSGGDTHRLKGALLRVPDLEQLFDGKVVAGSSSGALVLSRYYYENDDNTIAEGLGILPIKTICHYSEEKSEFANYLKAFGEDLPVYTIPEEKIMVMMKNGDIITTHEVSS